MNRDFLMLAKTFNPKKHGIGGWFLSEKLDGIRAFWDGGLSRGQPKNNIPWANHEGDARYQHIQIATGLWTRLGNVLHAPDWWLDKLPKIMLDGELWHGVRGDGQRQILTSIVKPLIPGRDWERVQYYIFDMPAPSAVFQDGRINNTNFKKIFKGFQEWVDKSKLDYVPGGTKRFEATYRQMEDSYGGVAVAHVQAQLPFQTSKALGDIQIMLDIVCDQKGEGLMLRKPESYWMPKRVDTLLKVKKLDDAEGIVIGYITGRRTDKGSKLLGLMGALILEYQGKRLELSGFTDAERALDLTANIVENGETSTDFDGRDAREWAENNPGQEVPAWISCVHFKRGDRITFRHRGSSLDGIPTEARYWRKRDVL